jgi:predicted Zn-dependent protease
LLLGDNPDNPAAELEVAQILVLAGKPKEAMALLEQKQAGHPTASVAAALAGLYAKAGDRDRAIDLLKSWVAAHQDDASLRAALGQLYLANKNYDAATVELERAAAERGNDAVVLNNLAWLYQRKGDSRALKTAERAYGLAPNSAAVQDTLGWILTSEDKADRGLRYLRAAGAALPQDLDIQYHLAVALQKTGSVADARAVLQKIANSPVDFDSKADAKALLAQIGNG